MRAIIYCRVSSDPSQRGKSVSEQEKECREVAAREGWDVAEVLVDNDIGASRYSRGSRLAYAQLDKILRNGDVLITWEASRAQRDLAAYLELRELCAERGVRWCYSGRVHDLSRGDDRFTTGLDALLAEKEVEQTRDRVLRAVRARAAAGRPHGKPPYGYRIARDPETGQSVGRIPDPETAPRVAEIVRRVLSGDSMYSICQDFTAREIPRPRSGERTSSWNVTTVRRIAENPAYAGLRVHRGLVVGPGTWEPIVSVDDHDRAKAIIANPDRNTRPKTGDGPTWLLSGILTCAHCGSICTRTQTRGKPIYSCNGRRHQETGLRYCTGRVIERVDPFVTEAIIRRLEGQDLVDDLFESDTEYRAAADEAAALRRRLDGFTDAAAEGEVSPTALARIEAKLLPQIDAAEQRARLRLTPLVTVMRGADARERWDTLSIIDKRELIRALTASITLAKVGRGRKTYADGDGIAINWK
ncbi:recombinase family protein [Gordonia sp. (in: high G+C Gram-positive bacteria)]|uniref:recombinase family protein n=1 Tax=Gordonia sp. (in: high G+C Gram-positive bacteria) TaxID=84139 RepID=UPI003C783DD0